MKVELTNDAVDGLIKSILLEDYRSLCSDIQRLEEMQDRSKYQDEDLKNNYVYKNAMEKMLEYYIGYDWERDL